MEVQVRSKYINIRRASLYTYKGVPKLLFRLSTCSRERNKLLAMGLVYFHELLGVMAEPFGSVVVIVDVYLMGLPYMERTWERVETTGTWRACLTT